MNCPRCGVILIPTHATGNRFECPRCNGRMSNRNDIGLLLSYAKRSDLLRAAGGDAYQGLTCPFCAGPMSPVELTHRLGSMEVDVCNPCEAMWTDQGEITKLSQSSVEPGSAHHLAETNPDLPRHGRHRAKRKRSITTLDVVLEALLEAFTDSLTP